MGIWYATRESVKDAGQSLSTRDNAKIDRAIDAASRTVEGILRRRFYPEIDTRYFRWPDPQGSGSYRLWLDAPELISLDTLTVNNGADTVAPSAILLEPANDGPPYDRIEIDSSASDTFSAGSTAQRAVAATGLWGYDLTSVPAGAVGTTVNASITTLEVTDGSLVGVGSLLTIGTERLTVTGRGWTDTTQDIAGDIAVNVGVVSFTVADGTKIKTGETVLVDSERMLVTDITGNVITVARAVDGTVLAAHTTGASVYASRSLTVVRGVLGTTAASHTAAAAITAQVYPSLIEQWAVAEAISTLNQQSAAYAATAGSGDNQREVSARALNRLRADAISAYGPGPRVGAV